MTNVPKLQLTKTGVSVPLESEVLTGVLADINQAFGGGLNTTLRDLARFGEMMRNRGRFNGQQIIPAAVVEDIERGGRGLLVHVREANGE